MFRLKVLLGLAFGAMFLSLLPGTLQNLGVSTSKVWVVSSLVLTGYSIAFISIWIAMSRRVMRIAPEIFNWFAFGRMAAGHAIVVILQLVAIFGLVDVSIPGAFVAALIWYLLHTTQQFFRMLFIPTRTVVNQEEKG